MTPSQLAAMASYPALSLEPVFRTISKRLLFVFNYHEVSDAPSRFGQEFNLNVTPRTFERQVRWIKKHFDVITPVRLLQGDFSLPAALITFDDGAKSIFTNAAPILRSPGASATVFMNMAVVEGQPFWSGLVTYLCFHEPSFRDFVAKKYQEPMPGDFFLYCTPADVEEFRATLGANENVLGRAAQYSPEFADRELLASSESAGLYLGNHLFNHYNAARLTREELADQYLLNERAMARYPNHVPLFSYPFGQPRTCYDRHTDAALRAAGAARVFTAFPLFNSDPSAYRFHRTSMFESIDTELRFRSHCVVPALINRVMRSRLWSEA